MKKVNLLALVVFLAALVWVFTFNNETTRSIQRTVGSWFSPFTRTGAKARSALSGSAEEEKSPEQLLRENTSMRRELDEMRLLRESNREMQKENEDLRGYMNFRKRYGFKLIPAEIINRKVSAWFREALIDKGLNNKIYEGTPVISPVLVTEGGVSRYEGALVGKVGTVEKESSTIVFVTDENCRVSAIIKGAAHVHGILMGARSSTKESPDLRLRFIRPESTVLEPGRQVLSEGLEGGIFPFGILLGEISEFRPGDGSPEAMVRPAVDFATLRYVFVIQHEEEPSQTAPRPPDAPKRP